uniref:Uncharacterized protein n=1 Tax=Nelumbo nucifera TaxID=4432 RepID=A0A822YQN9_NELNU|nr:TPA_asm: hypothetical protein HUJ06_012530 [Nelumbo nucifera]
MGASENMYDDLRRRHEKTRFYQSGEEEDRRWVGVDPFSLNAKQVGLNPPQKEIQN